MANSLGFDKSPSVTRVVVAMSGGVDSSVTAALLHEQGYDVVGVTLQLYDQGAAAAKKNACCAGQDIYDAHRVAEQLGFPHYVLDYESRFRAQVIDDFVEGYVRGETPLPCVRCNQTVKFRDLLQAARDLNADAMATGHYVRREGGATGATLHRGDDPARDQSYFLFATTQAQLDFLRFPLGALPKTATRDIAARFELPVAAKPDSQDICFVPDGDYASLVARLRPGAADPGDIVDEAGHVLGGHDGIIHFTVGQRRGLNLGERTGDANEPLYVLRVEPETKRVVVGPRAALGRNEVRLRDVNWLGEAVPLEGLVVTARVRSAMAPVAATFYASGPAQGRLVFHEPLFGIAPGQAGVIYDGTRVLGGGWIERAQQG